MKRPAFSLFAGAVACVSVSQIPPVKAATETVLYSFCSQQNCTDGQYPAASLIDVKGTLYGTTVVGGVNDGGTVFALNPNTGAETVLYSFCSQPNCADGLYPKAGLIDVKGTLYGTTNGTVFALNPNTGAETVIYSFCSQQNCTDGAEPEAGLIDVNGTLYGTTYLGGTRTRCKSGFGCGTVFALDPNTGAETVIHSFCSRKRCSDGAEPVGGLIDVTGTLYGTTSSGGGAIRGCLRKRLCGTVFSVDPSTGEETVMYTFCSRLNGSGYCTDGALPEAGLIDVNGTLYGTTAIGGANDDGTVFALNPNTGAETVIYSFCSQLNCTDGRVPVAGLIDVNGTLYGTTINGGVNDGGTVFALNPSTGAETVIYSFCSQQNCTDGSEPEAGLINVNGTVYGTTIAGGANGSDYTGGAVFAIPGVNAATSREVTIRRVNTVLPRIAPDH